MNRILSVLTATALLFTITACGGKKQPEQLVVKTKNVLSVLRDMSGAYEKKDLASFMADVAPSYREREAFSRSVESVFSKYETIRFTIQYARAVIMIEEKGRVKATLNWDAEWVTAGGELHKNGGRVTLIFEPEGLKLLSIEGKNPFVPQPGEMPGSK